MRKSGRGLRAVGLVDRLLLVLAATFAAWLETLGPRLGAAFDPGIDTRVGREYRNVAEYDSLPPLQGGSIRNINPG